MKSLKSAFNKIHKRFGGNVVLFTTDLTKQGCFGLAVPKEDGSWGILIEESLELFLQVHFLIHEYAHTLVPAHERFDHGPTWGVIHASIYSYIFDDVLVTRKRRKRNLRVGGA